MLVISRADKACQKYIIMWDTRTIFRVVRNLRCKMLRVHDKATGLGDWKLEERAGKFAH
jgi:hypothetical protein